ncbi:MAG TPA: MFS transporter [Solirubrobacteraceae bacterium]|nr:MFS transporter [Solirubrobacteraceae bacterium]
MIGKQRPQIPTGPAKSKRQVRLGRGFWILCAGAFINRAGTMVVPFMTLYLVSARGISIVVAGEMLAGFGGGAVVAPLIGGALADRIGRRVTLLGGTLTTAAIMVALAYARLTALIVVLIVLLGVTLEAPRPVTQALVADLVPEEDRARAYAALFWVSNLGFAAAMTSAGFLAQSAFTAIFWIDAGTALLFGALVWLFVPERSGPLDAERKRPSGYGLVMRDRTMLAFTAAVLVYYFVYLQSDSTLPLAVHRSGLAPHVYGLCMALNGVVICLAQPVLAPRLMRRDPGRVWAVGVALVGVGFALTAIASTTGGYLLSVTVRTFGEILPATVTGAIVARLAPEELRGRYSGLYGVAVASGWLTSSLGGTQLLSVSPLVLWESCAVLSAASAYGVVRLAPRLGPVGPERSKLEG